MALPTWSRSRTKKRGDGGDAAPPKDDAFQSAVRTAGRSAANRGRWVILGIIAIALGIGGVVLLRLKYKTSSAQATQLLAKAAAHEARGKIGDVESLVGPTNEPTFPISADEAAREAAIASALDELESSDAGSGPAIAAKLMLGADHLRDGDFKAAETTYREVVRIEDHPLGFLAREGVALALEGQGDYDGALRELVILAGDKGAVYREAALYHRARILAAHDRRDEAIETLKMYIEEYPLREFSLMGEDVRKLVEVVEPNLLVGVDDAPSPVEITDNAAPPAASE